MDKVKVKELILKQVELDALRLRLHTELDEVQVQNAEVQIELGSLLEGCFEHTDTLRFACDGRLFNVDSDGCALEHEFESLDKE